MQIVTEIITDEIALQPSNGKSITEKSWICWGDKNRLTRSIRSLYSSERGIAIDKLATNITREPQFANLEESDVIDRIIELTYDYPTRKDLNGYLSTRAKEQKTKSSKSKVSAFKSDDETCLLKSLKKQLSTEEIIEEMTPKTISVSY